jgi:peptidyl-tRNA hydrolase
VDEIKPDELRIYIVVRRDIGDILSKPKFGIQCAHAALAVFVQCLQKNPDRAWAYYDSGKQVKITLEVKDAKELLALLAKSRDLGFFAEPITDAARTELPEPTLTSIAVGPLWYQKEGEFLKRYRLYPPDKNVTQLKTDLENALTMVENALIIAANTTLFSDKFIKQQLAEDQKRITLLDSIIAYYQSRSWPSYQEGDWFRNMRFTDEMLTEQSAAIRRHGQRHRRRRDHD